MIVQASEAATTGAEIDSVQIDGLAKDVSAIRQTLAETDPVITRALVAAKVSIRILAPDEKFSDVARHYHPMDRLDFALCRGFYTPDEKVVVLRNPDSPTALHECAHVIDFACGDGEKPWSVLDDNVQRTYRRHKKNGLLVSAYSGVSVIEFMAEITRCRLPLGSENAPGRPSDGDRLRRIDPALVDLVDGFLAAARQRYLPS